MKVVIFGLAKTGTTALFYKIRNSLAPDTVCLFEPHSFDSRVLKAGGLRRLLAGGRAPDVLAKVLPFRPHQAAEAESFAAFEKQILTARDPRDRVVSRLLYVVYHATFYGRDEEVGAFLRLLERKEADPGSVSIRELLKTFAELDGADFSFDAWAAGQERHSVRAPLDFHERHPEVFLCKYEEMVEGRLGGLEEYLGLRLKGEAPVPPELRRVTRTRGYGNWRDWFTPEDVEYLRPVLRPYLERYYPDADWTLNARPRIPSEFCSGYVERLVNERRAAAGLPPFARAAAERRGPRPASQHYD